MINKNKLISLVGLFAFISLSLYPLHNTFANALDSSSKMQQTRVLASVVDISQEQDVLETEHTVAKSVASSSLSTSTTTYLDRIALIAGAIGVAIPWDSIGVLGIILFAIMLGLWWHYRKENVRDWHH